MATKQRSRTGSKPEVPTPRNRTGDSFFGWDGEVLVLNDNFCVRINEIVTTEEE